MDNWITQKVRSACVRQLVAWAMPVAILILVVATNGAYVRGFFKGPRVVTASDLEGMQLPDGSASFYVRTTGSRSVSTGLRQITVETQNGVETSRHVSAEYFALEVGQKFLIVKAPGDATTTTVEGELGPMPEDFASEFFKPGADSEGTPDRARFYPYYLEVSSFRDAGYWTIAIAVALAGLLLWKARPVWEYLQDQSSHPIVTRVMKWGDPNLIASRVEEAWRSPQALKGGEWRMTDQYLIRSSTFAFDVLRLPDLLWAYKRVTKHSVNFIPTGKTYAAMLHCLGGNALLTGSEKKVNDFLTYASQKVPWAVFGHSAELAKAWTKDNAGFQRAVMERMAKTSAAAPGPER